MPSESGKPMKWREHWCQRGWLLLVLFGIELLIAFLAMAQTNTTYMLHTVKLFFTGKASEVGSYVRGKWVSSAETIERKVAEAKQKVMDAQGTTQSTPPA